MPSLKKFPYRCNCGLEQMAEAIRFCLINFGTTTSRSTLVQQVLKDLTLAGKQPKALEDTWFLVKNRNFVKLYLKEERDLIRFSLIFGNGIAYKVDHPPVEEINDDQSLDFDA